MGCGCKGAGATQRFQLVQPSGQKQTYTSKTEAIAAMTVAPAGSKVVTTSP